jgi:proteasome assembly chaperone (PAC2) family protein
MLGLSAQRGIDAVCLMGETSGYIVDPMAAASVLSVLSKLAGVAVDPTRLNDRAAEMEKAIENIVEGEKSKDEELNYIG